MDQAWIPYCGAAPLPAQLLSSWNLDPVLLLVLAAVPLAWLRLVPQANKGSPAAMWGAWGLSILLFVTPFCALTSALFSARVVHHLLLGIVLAPLIALSFNRSRLPGSLALWTALQVIVFWFWHAPAAYSAALSSVPLYWVMQLSITGTATLFWFAATRSSFPAAIGALLGTMVAMGLLGALLTFAGAAVYAPHFASTLAWGLAPLEDQQLAGLIMWAPGGGFYLGAALILAARWMRRQELAGAAS